MATCTYSVFFVFAGADSSGAYTGEIDIIEGVHDNEHNQVTWHTGPGCYLTSTAPFTGTVVVSDPISYTQLWWFLNLAQNPSDTSCNGLVNGNAGCGITEWNRASYGPVFDAQQGGVFAMKWDEDGISVCKHTISFARPQPLIEITQGRSTVLTYRKIS
jgi:hypothetical protein